MNHGIILKRGESIRDQDHMESGRSAKKRKCCPESCCGRFVIIWMIVFSVLLIASIIAFAYFTNKSENLIYWIKHDLSNQASDQSKQAQYISGRLWDLKSELKNDLDTAASNVKQEFVISDRNLNTLGEKLIAVDGNLNMLNKKLENLIDVLAKAGYIRKIRVNSS